MDNLAELIPGLGDAIRIGKLSFQIGEMIGKYIAEKEEEGDSGIVTWRRIDVFFKEHPHWKEPSFFLLFFWIITLGFAFVVWLLLMLVTSIPRLIIKNNADDIEVTYSEFKMIRKHNGSMGICRWDQKHEQIEILLPSKYTIMKGFADSYIVKNKKGKYGLYNAELKTFAAKCEYDTIALYSPNAYLAIQGEYVSLMNAKGDRI